MAPTDDFDGRTVVYLGNRQAIQVLEDPDDAEAAAREERAVARLRSPIAGKRRTTVLFPVGTTLMDAAAQITHGQGVWQAHSDADKPAWVASTDPALAQLLGAHFGCEVREPLHDGEPRTDETTEA